MEQQDLEKQELVQRISDLEEEIREYKEIDKNNKTWLALLSHDFKGVFSSLIWILNMYNSNSISTEVLVEMLVELDSNARKNLKALDDTFWAAKIQSSNFLSEKETVNIKGLYVEIADYFSDSISKKSLIFEFEGKQEVNFECNKLILKSILVKVVENAIKFSYQGSKIIFAVDTSDNNRIHIQIEDFGVGMDDYTSSKMFSLNRAPIMGTENEKGTGLGLVFAKEALRLIDGTISIDSVKGKGTKVLINL